MEMKKAGYISAALVVIMGTIIFLIYMGRINVLSVDASATKSLLVLFSIPAILLFFAFCLLSNVEHKIIAYVDIGTAIIYTIALSFIIVSFKDSTENGYYNILSIMTTIAATICATTIPFLIRTQSKIHRYYKFIAALIILITCLLSLSTINSLTNINSLNDLATLQNKIKIIEYGVFISFIGIICNPMIGYASSDGLGGGGEEKSPKLIPNNAVSNPAAPLNYDNVSPVETATAINTPEGEIVSMPVQTISPNTPSEPSQNLVESQPASNLNVDDVAPELQFLLNNNDKKN